MTRSIWFAMGLAILSQVPTSGASLVADLNNDWSDTNNPNTATFGTWSYRAGTSLLPEVPNFTGAGTAIFPVTQPAWAPSNTVGNFIPAEFKARSVPAGYNFEVGDVVITPTDQSNGDSHGPANILWTSPITGTITISGGVWAEGTLAGRDDAWSLFVNGSLVSSGDNIDSHDRTHPFLFGDGTGGPSVLVQHVTVGDTIDLEIDRTTQFGYLVGANLTITGSAIPEPSTLILSGIGFSTLVIGAGVRRRRTG